MEENKLHEVQEKILLLTKFGCEYIDKGKTVLFLNDRCLLCSEIVEQKTNYIEYSYENVQTDFLNEYCHEIFDDFVTIIAPILSKINHVNYGIDYWSYYLGFEFEKLFWAFYSMYLQIKNVIQKYPNIKIVCFEDNEYDVAQLNITTATDMSYIYQLIGKQILVALNYTNLCVEKIDLSKTYTENILSKSCEQTRKRIRDRLRVVYDQIYKVLSLNTNYITNYNFSQNIRSLQRKLIGRIFVCPAISEAEKTIKSANIQTRNKIKEMLSAYMFEDEFENIFIHNILDDLSLVYLENYSNISKSTSSLKKMNFKTFIKFLYSPETVEYAAYVKENGGKVIECSHSLEEGWRLEKNLTIRNATYFFAWSERKYLSYDKYLECISYMLKAVKNINYISNTDILYARGSETSPYVRTCFDIVIAQRLDKYKMMLRPIDFYNQLDTSIQKCMVYRNRDDWGEASRELVEKYCVNVQFDDSFENGGFYSFEKRIKKARIVIVESIHSTSFFQTIMFGMPAIIIERLDYRGILNDPVLDLLEELKTVDIWFEDASVAGKVINENYERIDEWWNQPERMKVIEKIKKHLWVCLNGKSESEWWKEILAKLSQSKSSEMHIH